MSPVLTIFIMIAGILIAMVIRKEKRNKKKNQAPDDLYDNFHLGEMTTYDVPKIEYVRGKKIRKYSSRQLKESESQKTRKKEETNETKIN